MPSWESGESVAVCKLSVLINIFISAELIQCGGWVFLSVTEVVMIKAALLVWVAKGMLPATLESHLTAPEEALRANELPENKHAEVKTKPILKLRFKSSCNTFISLSKNLTFIILFNNLVKEKYQLGQ